MARLKDASNPANSLEGRFDLAYNAAHGLCLAALRWHGFRADHRYIVNGELLSVIATHDRAGRPLPGPYPYCGLVPAGFAFVAGKGPSSLDSRYFGPVAIQTLTAALPLWTSS